jgi:hypothetical protein
MAVVFRSFGPVFPRSGVLEEAVVLLHQSDFQQIHEPKNSQYFTSRFRPWYQLQVQLCLHRGKKRLWNFVMHFGIARPYQLQN